MQTEPDLGVDLNLTVDAEEECYECNVQHLGTKVATWYIETTSTCDHMPNPMPLCDWHKSGYDSLLRDYPATGWLCGQCDHRTDIVDIRRIPR